MKQVPKSCYLGIMGLDDLLKVVNPRPQRFDSNSAGIARSRYKAVHRLPLHDLIWSPRVQVVRVWGLDAGLIKGINVP